MGSNAVKIEIIFKNSTQAMGSGVIYTPNDCSSMYLFTVRHILIGEPKNNQEIIKKINEIDKIIICKDNEIVNLNINDVKIYPSETDDAMVIEIVNKIECEKLVGEAKEYKFVNIDYTKNKIQNKEIKLWGYPYKLSDQSTYINKTKLITVFDTILNIKNIDLILYNINFSNNNILEYAANEHLKAFSGSGLFIDDMIIGLHKGAFEDGVTFGKIAAVPIEKIVDIFENNNLGGKPKFCDDTKYMYRQEVKKEVYSNGFVNNLEEINSKITSYFKNEDVLKVLNEKFCKNIEKCSCIENPYMCKYYCAFLIILEALFERNSVILKDNMHILDNIELRFICCEGYENNKPDINSFIRALKTNNELKVSIKDNTLVIWGSEAVAGNTKEMNSKKFNRIIPNIANTNDIIHKKGIVKIISDITNSQKISICHINQIFDDLTDIKNTKYSDNTYLNSLITRLK